MHESVTTRARYYIVIADPSKNTIGIIIDNRRELILPRERMLRPLDLRIRGFLHFAGLTPLLVYNNREGRLPKDFEKLEGYWLVSGKTKAVFEQTDKEAFDAALREPDYNPPPDVRPAPLQRADARLAAGRWTPPSRPRRRTPHRFRLLLRREGSGLLAVRPHRSLEDPSRPCCRGFRRISAPPPRPGRIPYASDEGRLADDGLAVDLTGLRLA